MRALVALLCVGLVALTSATQFTDCGSDADNVVLDFEGCDIPPCIVQRGKSYAAHILFDGTHDEETLTNVITAKIAGIETPWPGIDTDGCNNLAASDTPCPIVPGNSYDWFMPVDIFSDYPTITTSATIKLVGSDGHPCVCINIPVTIIA